MAAGVTNPSIITKKRIDMSVIIRLGESIDRINEMIVHNLGANHFDRSLIFIRPTILVRLFCVTVSVDG